MHIIIINLEDVECKRGLIDFAKCSLIWEAFIPTHRKENTTTYNAILLASMLLHQQGSERYGRSDLFGTFLKDGDDNDRQPLGKSQKEHKLCLKNLILRKRLVIELILHTTMVQLFGSTGIMLKHS